MMLFRSVQASDIEAIHSLTAQSGVGITTLPKDPELLQKRIAWSLDSFKKKVTIPEHEYYFFVLEDPETNKVVGTSAIEAKIGFDSPFYSYKVSKHTRVCHSLNIRNDYEVLDLVNDYQGNTEICTLFLDPEWRKNMNGLLLSKARFLFMAQHSKRFSPMVIAEMRGMSDEHGESPFWNNIGIHFFYMPFAKADELSLSTNKQFISDLMPRNAIYVTMLSPQARAVIAKPHQSTLPAMSILLKEGFRFHNYIDIFDGGPTLEVPLFDIKTLAKSRIFTISNISDDVVSEDYLLANTQLDFRATLNEALIHEDDKTCIVSNRTAELLQLKLGDEIRVAPLRLEETHLPEQGMLNASQ